MTYDLRTQTPPAELPSTATRATLTVRPSFENWWWLSLPDSVRIRSAPDEDWSSPSLQGQWSFPLRVGQEHRIELKVTDVRGVGETQLVPLAFRVGLPPPPPIPLWSYLLAFIGFLTAMITLASTTVGRKVRIAFGQRLSLVSENCDYEVVVRPNGSSFDISIRDPQQSDFPIPIRISPPEPEESAWIRQVTDQFRMRGSVLIVAADGVTFRYPWARHFTGDLAAQADPPVAGQIVPLGPDERLRPPRVKQLVFASIGCRTPHNRTDVIPGLERHLQRLAGLLEHRFVQIGEESTDADVPLLLRALETADIVHVMAHATPASIDLKDRTATRTDLKEAFKTHMPRCRLLVLAACEINRLGGSDASFIETLVQSGTSVLGATEPLDPIVIETFFEAFYKDLVPRKTLEGVTVAEAMRAGGRACAEQFTAHEDIWRANIASLVFYGNPTLRLTLVGRNVR